LQLNDIDQDHYRELLQQARSRLVAKIIESNIQSILKLNSHIDMWLGLDKLYDFDFDE
jgi:hypothetical protein